MPIPTTIVGRRWLIRLGVVVVVSVAFYFGLLVYLDWEARRAWAAACAEADRLDPGWRWDDLVAASLPVGTEQNSVDRVAAAARWLPLPKKTGGGTHSFFGVQLIALQAQNRLSPGTVTGVEEMLVDAASDLVEIDRIAEGQIGGIAVPAGPALRSTLPRPADSLDVIKWLIYPRLAVRADKGDADGALDDFRLMVALARLPGDSPNLIHNLYATAERFIAAGGLERLLAQGEPSPAALVAARKLVEMESARPALLPAVRGERARIEDTLRALDDGRLSRDEVATSGIFADPVSLTKWKKADEWLTRLTGADLRRSKGASLFRHHTQVIEWLKESPDGLKIHEGEWAALRSRMSGAAQATAVSLSRYVADAREADARFRCAAAALAAEQFRQEAGRWPATLAELVPKWLAAIPRDPCDLQPLRLARRPDGIVIYSVGEDGTDEGGAIASDGAAKATDIGIRLWDVGKRRQPPRR